LIYGFWLPLWYLQTFLTEAFSPFFFFFSSSPFIKRKRLHSGGATSATTYGVPDGLLKRNRRSEKSKRLLEGRFR
jgi:hypothetical protein